MGKFFSCPKRLLIATYFRYSKKCKTLVYPVKLSFYSSSTIPRNLNDIAARHARYSEIKWHYLVVKDLYGNIVSQRYRNYYQYLIK